MRASAAAVRAAFVADHTTAKPPPHNRRLSRTFGGGSAIDVQEKRQAVLQQPGGTFVMRLMLLCAAMSIVSPTYAVSPEYPAERISWAGAASAATAAVTTPAGADPVVSPVPATASEHPIDQPKPEEIRQEPIANSSSNASGAEVQKFTKTELCSAAASVAAANNLPVPFFANLIQQESGFKPHVVSPAGAQGIAQFMPRVAASYGLDNPFEPFAALKASARLLVDLIDQFGNVGLAAAAYNAGPKRVQDWMAKRRKLPAETRHYVRSITGRPAEQWVNRGLKDAEATLPLYARCPDMPVMVASDGEVTKPVSQPAKIVSSSRPQTPLSNADSGRVVTNKVRLAGVRRAMPQPSQFAMGLPVSRFAAMAKPVGVIEKKSGLDAGRTRSKASRNTLMSQFAAMPTPVIMVEEKSARPPKTGERISGRLKLGSPQAKIAAKSGTKPKAQGIRLAAAR